MRRSSTVRLIAAASAFALLGAVAACSGNGDPTSPPTTPNGTNTDTAVGELGQAPGPSVTTTTAAPTPPPVPDSTTPSKAGYVWAYNATQAAYVAAGTYLYNSSGGPITLTRSGTGRYSVTFAGLADAGGVAHAQAYGDNHYCNVESWGASGADQIVSVACRTAAGALADTRFTASFAAGRMGHARFSYLWANDASAGAKYAPASAYAADAVNTPGLSVERTATGRYSVFLPSAGPNLPDAWTVQVTAYATDARCKLLSFSEASRTAKVDCRTPGGALADARFALTFASEGSAIGRTDRKFGFYADNESSTANPSTGVYRVTAAGNGGPGGLLSVTARGGDAAYCTISGWNPASANMIVDVGCYDASGAPLNAGFEVALSL